LEKLGAVVPPKASIPLSADKSLSEHRFVERRNVEEINVGAAARGEVN